VLKICTFANIAVVRVQTQQGAAMPWLLYVPRDISTDWRGKKSKTVNTHKCEIKDTFWK
jgi:hypothetical protein